ncbi:TadE/TadG family type IV pilus assembly protein (plasmid) [Pseudarthrobacter sp. P1]|uniref:TadE/TadG family type IV pilus assembly protein n=1 Tax=Pseudarthrobacter sp. P1 TaxID=3418418 RepID=UPI003CEC0B57
MKSRDSERGAVAVEFALLLPVLLLLVLGIMEFGRAYNVQISASNAAREGARYVAVNYSQTGYSDAKAAGVALAAGPSLPAGTTATVSFSTGKVCAAGVTVTVKVMNQLKWMTGYLPFAAPKVTGIGVMQCGG